MNRSIANVVSLLAQAAERTPEREAIIVALPGLRSERISFSELWRRVDQAGCGLINLGVRRGDRVVIMVPMSIDLYVVLLAVLKIGASTVFVDPWVGRRQIAEFTAFAEPKAFIGISKSHLLRLIDRRLREIPVAVTTGSSLLGIPARHQLRHLLRASGDGVIALVNPEEAALITFTTGSSGTPKGVNRTHGYLLSQHSALQTEFPYTEEDIDLTMFPVFALNNLAKGITTVVPNIDFRKVADADGNEIRKQIVEASVTTITASPPLIDQLLSAVESHGLPKTLRRILVGGAPVSDRQLQNWLQAFSGIEIIVVYGSTEAEPVAHIEAEERLRTKSDVYPKTPGFCTGIPTALLDTKIIKITEGPVQLGADGWQDWGLSAGEIGELVVRGNHVGKEYFRNPEATKANKIHDSEGLVWHRMGDTGYFDGAGRFWLTGRVHSTIKRAGEFVHPQLVELAATGVDVIRVAAVGMKDKDLGERVTIVIESKNREPSFAYEVAKRLESSAVVFDEIILTTIPLPVDPRHNSKVDYGELANILSHSTDESKLTCWSRSELLATQSEELR